MCAIPDPSVSAAVILLFLAYVSDCQGGTQCYKCTTTKPPMYSNETVRLCSEFDYSERFVVDCPYSTFCMKRYFSAKIPVPINATERDCANQKYVTQNFKNGRWQPEVTIEEPYKEGCSVVDDKGFRTSKTIDCYCKSYLCNSSDNIFKRNSLTVITALLISFFKSSIPVLFQ